MVCALMERRREMRYGHGITKLLCLYVIPLVLDITQLLLYVIITDLYMTMLPYRLLLVSIIIVRVSDK